MNKLVEGTNVHMKFSRFTLGIDPLVLVSVKAVTEVPNEVGLDIETKWAATDPEVQLDVQFMGLTLPIAIEKVEFFGVVRACRRGPLCDWWPTFSDMQVAFIGKPTINFNLRLIGGDITAFPFVEKLDEPHQERPRGPDGRPNRLDIVHHEQGSLCALVNRSGILRIRVLRAVHLPNLDIMKAAAKMRPAVELEIRDGTTFLRAPRDAEGRWAESPLRRDVRRARARRPRRARRIARRRHGDDIQEHAERGAGRAPGPRSASPRAYGARSANGEPVTNAREEMSKAEAALQASTSFEGETRLYKTAQSALGVAQFEAGTLFDAPNERRSERLELEAADVRDGEDHEDVRVERQGAGRKGAHSGDRVRGGVPPFEEDLGEDDAEKEKVRDVTLRTLLSGENLDQFCGVLHVTLVRGDSLVSKDANGRSDPFVKLSLGKQQHKSSTKKAR